ncbi:hypothetical protein HMPREF9009_03598 [Bacteroides sp. 3_1_13]|jgi:hypothetical protein|nr:hypothetical protein HMPREF9009_03598 [Bacteroides sp. 3_1_13]
MNDLMKMRIFGLLSGTSQQVSNEEMQEAYGEFIEQIKTVSNGNDYSTTYRILVATRIEIASLETSPLYGQGENALKKLFLQKTLGTFGKSTYICN